MSFGRDTIHDRAEPVKVAETDGKKVRGGAWRGIAGPSRAGGDPRILAVRLGGEH
jgi:hypothetical protein